MEPPLHRWHGTTFVMCHRRTMDGTAFAMLKALSQRMNKTP